MQKSPISHVIKDPVHGTMQFTHDEDNWIKPFIDSPNFQRLRHIKQLGMADYIFPGAVHTRFNHCLGCSYTASQISNKIGLAQPERQLVIIACLLHDIGHGPFSHTFEDIFHEKLIRHEAWTPFFLGDYCQKDFFQSYNKRNPDHPLDEEKFSHIENMIMHKSSGKKHISDIVSSQLDADRLDYLLRDSHFCGVAYGHYDFSWMINCMTRIQTDGGERLGITHKGVGVVEHYLMARRLMTRNIYHYQKKLALEFLMIQLLGYLSASIDEYTLFSDIKSSRLGKFLIAANEFNAAVINHSDIEQLREVFLTANYHTYRELSDDDIFAVIKQLSAMNDKHPAAQLAKRIQHRNIPFVVRIDSDQNAATILDEFKIANKQIQPWQLAIIKNPHQSYSVAADPIYVLTEMQGVKPLNELSLMINAISDKHENSTLLCVDTAIVEEEKIKRLIQKIVSP